MEIWQLAVFGVAGFVSSILSGISGAGGGFIMTPLGILLGLTPAQSVATGKFSGLSVTLGSLTGFGKASQLVHKRRVLPVMVLALIVGLLVPFVIRALDNGVYQLVLGVIILLMIPVMIYKKVGLTPAKPTPLKRVGGGMLLTLALALQGAFSGGLGTLVNVVLMSMLGMTALEANITKRWSQLILNITIIIGVLGSNLVQWPVAAIGVVSTFAGGYLGGRMAAHKGDAFIMRVMVAMMAISGVALIIGV